MKFKIFILLIISLSINISAQEITSKEALERLIKGNERFTSENFKNADRDNERIQQLYNGQQPYAIILTCSDSRVAPEIVFDEGLGELFVIRLIGNIADESSIASIEYAAEHLGTPLLVVMGHEKCGAVTAALEAHDYGVNINSVMERISPAVEKVRSSEGDLLKNSIIENAKMVNETLRKDSILKHLIDEGKLITVPAYYHLNSGHVEILN